MSILKPIDHEKTLQEGAKLWATVNDKPPEFADVIWLILEEAAETQRAIPRPRPSDRGSFWPDLVYAGIDLFVADRERASEASDAKRGDRPTEEYYVAALERRNLQVSAAALRRHDVAMLWLRFINCRNQKSLRMALILALAGGMSQSKAASSSRFASLQYTDRRGVAEFRKRALENMEHGVRQICPKTQLWVYAAA